MKRDELTALGIEPDAIDKIMALHGKDVEKHKAAVQAWEEKHTADTTALQTQLTQLQYNTAQNSAMCTMRFSSESAKTAFCNALQKAELPIENDTLVGFDDFANAYRQSDPAAFAPTQKTPLLVQPTGGTTVEGHSQSALRAAFGL